MAKSRVQKNKSLYDELESELEEVAGIDNLDDDISTATSTLSSIPSHSDFPDLTSPTITILNGL